METWGNWSLCSSWVWHDDWVVGGLRLSDLGISLIVIGPVRITLTWPVSIGVDVHEACTELIPFAFGCTA